MRPLPRRVNRENAPDRKRSRIPREDERKSAGKRKLDPIDYEERWLEVQEF